jgi:hypothetical protein
MQNLGRGQNAPGHFCCVWCCVSGTAAEVYGTGTVPTVFVPPSAGFMQGVLIVLALIFLLLFFDCVREANKK